ncbi:MAG: Zn-dependent hydrolase [Trueperaceae bacterium]|jgi:L-ascorbate metabolism protein UlaG (beta-lactamase superfamily)|nr:Zn-dependent hydrolase [Trueperaceae bacterium]|tara:strand:- start:186 stop:860 length:675 start_codon:yes stop_codon:yes gene_type:complete
MQLTWYGHASFRIESSDGKTIVTDPYDPDTSGYKSFTEPADLVVISSATDSFHCNAHLIPGAPTIINALEIAQNGRERTELGIRFEAIEAMEALNHRYHDPDQNAMYRLNVDGINIGHLGDVGNALSKSQLEFFENTDILLALAGGHPTIELDDLKRVINDTAPRIVIPMHFRTLRYKPRNSLWIDSFLALFPNEQIDFAFESNVTLTKDNLPTETRILVMDYC